MRLFRVFVLVIFFGFQFYSFGSPIYFTFSGKIKDLNSSLENFSSLYAISVGSLVSYTFLVDVSRNGFRLANGVKEDLINSSQPNAEAYTEYFFDSLLTPAIFAQAIPNSASGNYSGIHSVTQVGSVYRNNLAFQTLLGSAEHGIHLILYIPDTSITNYLPKEGAEVIGKEVYYAGNIEIVSATMQLTLQSIGDKPPAAIHPRIIPIKSIGVSLGANRRGIFIQYLSKKNSHSQYFDLSGRSLPKIYPPILSNNAIP